LDQHSDSAPTFIAVSLTFIISLLISIMTFCISGSLTSCCMAFMTSALCCRLPTTLSWLACCFICISTLDRLALAVYSRLTALREFTTSLASTRHTSLSPFLAASLIERTAFCSSRLIPLICLSME